MSSVDKRVVEMQFDNQQFEKNVSQTMSTLDKFKEKLQFKNAGQGLENFGAAVQKVSLDGLSAGVDALNNKFSALGIVGITAIQNITNSAINAGKNLISSLTVEPITQGFNEYELKMGSIQTIMAGTGESLETVNGYLDELNTYSDKTIYSFSDMTSSIGKFTNAGVHLDKAVAAIKGVSNEAAVSGANAEEASHAMYNFAQALSSGYVKLIDWKSIENANMATKEFKQQLIDSAVAAGTLTQAEDGMYKTTKGNLLNSVQNFNDTLQDQWMTSDVLITTLGKYSDETTDIGKKAFAAAQDIKTFSQMLDTLKEAVGSGWAETWQYVFGDFNEAKTLFTDLGSRLGNVIAASSRARNTILLQWKNFGGQKDISAIFQNLISAFESVANPVKEAFRDVFNFTGLDLKKITQAVEDFTHSLILNQDQQRSLKSATEGVASVFKAFFSVLKGVFEVLGSVGKALSPLGNLLLKLAGYIGDVITKVVDWAEKSGLIQDIAKFIGDAIIFLSNKIKDFVDYLKQNQYVQEFLQKISDGIQKLKDKMAEFKFPSFEEFLDKIKEVYTNFKDSNFIQGAIKTLGTFFSFLKQGFEGLKSGSGNGGFDLKGTFLGGIKAFADASGTLKDKLSAVKDYVVNIFKGMTPFLEGVWGKIKDVGGKIWDFLKQFFAGFQFKDAIKLAEVLSLYKIVNAIANLINSTGDVAKQSAKVVASVAGVLKGVKSYLKGNAFKARCEGIKDFAEAIAILAGSLAVLAFIPAENLQKAAWALGGIITAMMVITVLFDKLNKSDSTTFSFKDKIADALGGFSKSAEIIAFSLSALIFVKALSDLADVLDKYDKLQLNDMGTALLKVSIAAGIIMGVIATMGLTTKKSLGGMMGASLVMLTFVLVLKQMIEVLHMYDQLDLNNLPEALKNIAKVMTMFTGAISVMGLTTKKSLGGMLGAALVMLTFVYVLKQMVDVINSFQNMDPSGLARGMKAVSELLMILSLSISAIGLTSKKSLLGMVGAALAMFTMVYALQKLEDVMQFFGDLSWEQINKGLTVICSLIGSITLAIAIMGKLGSPKSMVAFAIMIGVLTASLYALSGIDTDKLLTAAGALAGVIAVVAVLAGLSALAKNSKNSLIVIAVTIGVVAASLYVLSQVPFENLMGAVISLSIVIGMLAVLLGVSKLAEKSMGSLIAVAALIVGLTLSMAVLASQPVDGIIAAGIAIGLIVGLLAVLVGVSSISKTAFINLIFLAVIVAEIGIVFWALCQLPTDAVLAVGQSLSEVLLSLSATILILGLIPVWSGLVAIANLSIFVGGLYLLLKKLGELSQIEGIHEVIAGGSGLLSELGNALGSFVGSIVSGFATAVSDSFPKIAQDLSDFMTNLQPFITGAAAIPPGILDGINEIVACVVAITAGDFVNSIGDFLLKKDTLSDFGTKLNSFGDSIVEYSNKVSGGKIDAEAIKGSADAAAAMVEVANSIPKSDGLEQLLAGGNNIDKFGGMLCRFADSLTTYSSKVSDANLNYEAISGSAQAAKGLADVMNSLPENDLGTTGLDTFGSELPKLGQGLSDYCNNIKDVKPAIIFTSAKAASALSEVMQSLPKTGGMSDFWSGSMNIETFSTQLSAFGKGIAAYSDAITDMKDDVATKSQLAADAMSAIVAVQLPNSGGAAGWWAGNNDIDAFGYMLQAFSINMKQYSETITQMNNNVVSYSQLAANAMEILVAVPLPNSGGAAGFWAGENDIDDFGHMLMNFGTYIALYSMNISGLQEDVLSKTQTAAGIMSTLVAIKLPNSGGFLGGLVGNNDIDDYGHMLLGLSTYLSMYAFNISNLPDSSLEKTNEAVSILQSLLSVNIPATGGLLQAFTGTSDFQDFGKKLSSFALNMADFSTNLQGFDGSQVDSLCTSVTDLVAMLNSVSGVGNDSTIGFVTSINSLANVSIDDLAKAFSDGTTTVSDALVAVLDATITDANAKSDEFDAAGVALITALALGMSSQEPSVTAASDTLVKAALNILTGDEILFNNAGVMSGNEYASGLYSQEVSASAAASSLASSALNGIADNYRDFYEKGSNAGQGYVNGINSKVADAQAAASTLGSLSVTATAKSIDSNSPSKKFGKLGMYADMGFANAMTDYAYLVTIAAGSMSEQALNSTKESLLGVNNLLSDMDNQPVIRPVLDLSNVSSGMNRLNSSFNSYGLSVGGMNAVNDIPGRIGGASQVVNLYVNGIHYNDGDAINMHVSGFVDELMRRANMYG